jgi:membrane-associated protein
MPGVDLEALIRSIGYLGVFLIVFAETGLLIGFFLPGDTLLITAGLLAGRGELELAILIPLLIVAAVLGDATGYQIGRHTGPRIFKREDSRFFKRRHLDRATEFYEKHGGKTIIIARFLALIRTFAPTVAGAAGMPYRRFFVFNLVGGATWVPTMTILGFWFGKKVDNLELFFTGMIVIMVTVSLAPGIWHVYRERKTYLRRG